MYFNLDREGIAKQLTANIGYLRRHDKLMIFSNIKYGCKKAPTTYSKFASEMISRSILRSCLLLPLRFREADHVRILSLETRSRPRRS